MNNNSLDNVNSLNNNIEIRQTKHRILLHFSTGMIYQNYSNVFVILDYEITADSAVYLCIYTELYSNCDRLWRK